MANIKYPKAPIFKLKSDAPVPPGKHQQASIKTLGRTRKDKTSPGSPMLDLEEEMEEWPLRMGGGGGGGPAGVRDEEEDEMEEEEGGGGGFPPRL